MTELAPDPELFPNADESTTLHAFLEFYRSVFVRKAEGLSEAGARHTVGASEMHMLGLVRHMAEVERGWFRREVKGDDLPPLYYGDEDPDGDFHPTDDDTLDDALAVLAAEVAAAREIADGLPMDQLVARPRPPEHRLAGFQPTVRWVIVHMIEEYARHCGHADLIREAVDGTTGD